MSTAHLSQASIHFHLSIHGTQDHSSTGHLMTDEGESNVDDNFSPFTTESDKES